MKRINIRTAYGILEHMIWFYVTFSPNEAAFIFFNLPPQNHPKISCVLVFFTYSYWSLCGSFRKNQVSGFRRSVGSAPYTRNRVFFSNLWNSSFLLLYYSACKKATAMVFIWGDREYSAVHFEYKTASERYLVAEI